MSCGWERLLYVLERPFSYDYYSPCAVWVWLRCQRPAELPATIATTLTFSHTSLSISDDVKTYLEHLSLALMPSYTSLHSGVICVSMPRFPIVHQLPRSGGRLGPAFSRTFLNPY